MLATIRKLFTRIFGIRESNVGAKGFASTTEKDTSSIDVDADDLVSSRQQASPIEVVPYDPELLDRARMQWQFGEWESLVQIDQHALGYHPERAKLALLIASAHQQVNDHVAARRLVNLAHEWGCARKLIAQVLVAGVHNTLGKAAALTKDEPRVLQHFRASVVGVNGDLRLASQARAMREIAQLGLASAESSLWLRIGQQSDSGRRIASQVAGKRVVLVAGIPRSGSTWLYNCVRLLLLLKYPKVYAGWVADYDPSDTSPVHLIKIHEPDDEFVALTDEIYTSRRDIREIAGSMVRMGWAEKGELFWDQIGHYVNDTHPYWTKHSRLEVEYSEILKAPGALIEKIGHSLGIHLDVLQAKGIRDELLRLDPKENYDKVTQLHPNHKSLGQVDYRQLVGSERMELINSRFHDWLVRYGYVEEESCTVE